jgi:endonuclease III
MPATDRARLKDALTRLEKLYGRPKPPPKDPWVLLLLENVAYLVDDARRARTFATLKKRIGLAPAKLLATPDGKLADIIEQGGMLAPHRAHKVKRCAELALEIGLPNLRKAVRSDPALATKLLRRFPGIGIPSAEKILLFCRGQRALGPDSNALRVLRRLGHGKEYKTYDRTYRSVTDAVAPGLPADYPSLIRAHQLLRRHGQETCKTSAPRCDACPLAAGCVWFRSRRPG